MPYTHVVNNSINKCLFISSSPVAGNIDIKDAVWLELFFKKKRGQRNLARRYHSGDTS